MSSALWRGFVHAFLPWVCNITSHHQLPSRRSLHWKISLTSLLEYEHTRQRAPIADMTASICWVSHWLTRVVLGLSDSRTLSVVDYGGENWKLQCKLITRSMPHVTAFQVTQSYEYSHRDPWAIPVSSRLNLAGCVKMCLSSCP